MKCLVSTYLLILFTSFGQACFAQVNSNSDTIFTGEVVSSDWVDHGLSLGMNHAKFTYAEIGYYKSNIWELGGFPTISSSWNLGAEFSNSDDFILVPKIHGRVHAYFFNAGLTGLWYTNFNDNWAIRLRPEIGVGLWNLDINYGYNIKIYSDNFSRINKHQIAIRFYLKVFRKFGNEYDSNGNIRPID